MKDRNLKNHWSGQKDESKFPSLKLEPKRTFKFLFHFWCTTDLKLRKNIIFWFHQYLLAFPTSMEKSSSTCDKTEAFGSEIDPQENYQNAGKETKMTQESDERT